MEQRISIERMEQAVNLFGSFDENVRLIESEFKVTISNREGELRVNGEVEDTMLATKALNALLTLSNRGEPITEQNVRYVISLVRGTGGPHQRADAGRHLHQLQGPPHQAQDHRTEKIHRVRFEKHHHHRRRPRRYGQNVPRRRRGGRGVPRAQGEPYHPDAPRGRGG